MAGARSSAVFCFLSLVLLHLQKNHGVLIMADPLVRQGFAGHCAHGSEARPSGRRDALMFGNALAEELPGNDAGGRNASGARCNSSQDKRGRCSYTSGEAGDCGSATSCSNCVRIVCVVATSVFMRALTARL